MRSSFDWLIVNFSTEKEPMMWERVPWTEKESWTKWMIATKIWGEMTRKVGVSPPMLEPEKVQARVSVGSNCQAGVSSIASQVGSRSPGPRWESDPGFLFPSFAYSWQLPAGWGRDTVGGKLSLVISVRHISPPTFLSHLHFIIFQSNIHRRLCLCRTQVHRPTPN